MSEKDSTKTRQLTPCPFCGHLVLAGAEYCRRCRSGLDERSRRRMLRLLGPWFVLNKSNPTGAGLNWSALMMLISRGRIRPTTTLRGPASSGLWRFAKDTPSVATAMGICWACHANLEDRRVRRCPECGQAVNGPLDWPSASDVAAEEPRQRSGETVDALEAIVAEQPDADTSDLAELADSSPPAAAAPRPTATVIPEREPESPEVQAVARVLSTQVVQPPRKSGVGTGAIVASLLLVAAGIGAALWTRFLKPDPSVVNSRPAPVAAQPANPARAGADVTPPAAGVGASRVAGVASDPPPVTAPVCGTRPAGTSATGPATTAANDANEELERQRAEAAGQFQRAQQAYKAGQTRRAEALLLLVLNNHGDKAWPDGAVDMLKKVQGELQASEATEPELPAAEMARQQKDTADLLDKAKAFYGKKELLRAQECLLKIMNTYDHRAWPAGVNDEYNQVEKEMKTSSGPEFFNAKGKPR